LIVLAICWMSCLFCYWLINFQLKYLGGNIFTNAISASVAELFAKLITSYVLIKVGIKSLFLVSFAMTGAGTIALVVWTSPSLIPILLMFLRFGVSMGIVGCYVGVILLMPT